MPEEEEHTVGGSQEFMGLHAVRQRPSMYFGTGPRGFEDMVAEVVSNSLDEYAAGHATSVSIRIDGQTCIVEDDGRGLPFDLPGPGGPSSLATHFLTTMHTTATADGHAPHVHTQGPFGAGLAAINFVSRTLSCSSWRCGVLWKQEFERGVPLGPPVRIREGDERGTTVEFTADPEIWGTNEPRFGVVRAQVFLMAHLFPGIRVRLGSECFHSPGGLRDYMDLHLQALTQNPWSKRAQNHFSLVTRAEDVDLTVTIAGDASRGNTHWRTWANGCETGEHGSHRLGIEAALESVGWRPEVVLAHVVMHDPRFAGPSRGRLNTPEIVPVVRDALIEPFRDYCSQNGISRVSTR